jgi:hypothetical protein
MSRFSVGQLQARISAMPDINSQPNSSSWSYVTSLAGAAAGAQSPEGPILSWRSPLVLCL